MTKNLNTSGRTLNAAYNTDVLWHFIERKRLTDVERWMYIDHNANPTDSLDVHDDMEYWLYFLKYGQYPDKKPHAKDIVTTTDVAMLLGSHFSMTKRRQHIRESVNPIVHKLALSASVDLHAHLSLEDLNPNKYFTTPTDQQWLAIKSPNIFAEWVVSKPSNNWDIQALHAVFTTNNYKGDHKTLRYQSIVEVFINILPIKILKALLLKEQKDWLVAPKRSENLCIYQSKKSVEQKIMLVAQEAPFLLNKYVQSEKCSWPVVSTWLKTIQKQLPKYSKKHTDVMLHPIEKIFPLLASRPTHPLFTIAQTIEALYESPKEKAIALLEHFGQIENQGLDAFHLPTHET